MTSIKSIYQQKNSKAESNTNTVIHTHACSNTNNIYPDTENKHENRI